MPTVHSEPTVAAVGNGHVTPLASVSPLPVFADGQPTAPLVPSGAVTPAVQKLPRAIAPSSRRRRPRHAATKRGRRTDRAGRRAAAAAEAETLAAAKLREEIERRLAAIAAREAALDQREAHLADLAHDTRAFQPQLLTRVGNAITTVVTLLLSGTLFVAAGLLFFMHLSIQPVLTGSMRPTYGPGWAIVSRSIPITSVRLGMIV